MLTLNEIATQLKVSKRTLYRWIKSGKLEALKLDGIYRVEEEVYNQFLNKGKNQSIEPSKIKYLGRANQDGF